MTDLTAFPVMARWPASHPDGIQLYSLPTPNGVTVSIMLEETGLPYEPHAIDIGRNGTDASLTAVPAWLARGLAIPARVMGRRLGA